MRQGWRLSRAVRRVVLLSGLAVLVCTVSIVSITSLTIFLPLRQELAGQILSSIVKRDTEIRGNVDLTIGHIISIRIEDAFIQNEANSIAGNPSVFDSVSFDAGIGILAGRTASISNFKMYGADIELEVGSREAAGQSSSISELPSIILNSPVLADISLGDVALRFVDPRDGWRETLEIDTLKLSTAKNSERTYAVLDGKLNGTPFEVIGEIVRLTSGGTPVRGDYDFGFEIPGLTARAQGSVDTSQPVAEVSGRITSGSHSLSELFSSLGLVSGLDGTADISWRYQGPLDNLGFSGIEAVVESELGDRVTVSGSIMRSVTEPQLDLDFSASLAPIDGLKSSLIAIQVEEISGTLSGPLSALSINRAHVKTDTIIIDSETLGPISVGRIVKHPDNRVGLEEIVINDGPEDSPHLIVTGHVHDILGLMGAEFEGEFNIPAAVLLGETGPARSQLGVLKGDLTLGDASGEFGIDRFRAYSAETDLFALSLELSVPEVRVLSEIDLAADIIVPEPQLVLSALHLPIEQDLPPLELSSSLKLGLNNAVLSGSLTSGSSRIEGDINVAPVEESQNVLLTGSVHSDLLDLSDIAGFLKLPEIDTSKASGMKAFAQWFSARLYTDLSFAVEKLASGKDKAGNLAGSLVSAGNELSVTGFQMAYLGGTLRGDFSIELSEDTATARASGRMEKFPFKRLMNELGLVSPISSTVYASFDIAGNASSGTDFLKSLSGRLTASLWGGTLPDRMVELAGLSAFTWLVTGNQKNTAKLLCAVVPLHFKNGVARTGATVVETENVQIIGNGTVNFRSGTLDLSFAPRAKRKQLVEIVSPFQIKGKLTSPELVIQEAGAGRVVGEIASLPLNIIGHIFRGSGQIDETARPCVLSENSGPK